jgi:hypothetical protein
MTSYVKILTHASSQVILSQLLQIACIIHTARGRFKTLYIWAPLLLNWLDPFIAQIEINQDIILSHMRRTFWVEWRKVLVVFKTFLVDLERGKQTALSAKFSKDIKLGNVISNNDAKRKMQNTWRNYKFTWKILCSFWNKNCLMHQLQRGWAQYYFEQVKQYSIIYSYKKELQLLLQHVKNMKLDWGRRTGCWDVQTDPPPPLGHNWTRSVSTPKRTSGKLGWNALARLHRVRGNFQ